MSFYCDNFLKIGRTIYNKKDIISINCNLNRCVVKCKGNIEDTYLSHDKKPEYDKLRAYIKKFK